MRLIGHLIGGGLGVLLLASAAPAQEGPVQITFNADTLAWTLARQPEGLAPPMMEHRVDGGWMIDRALRDGHSIDDLIRSPRIVASVVLATSPLTAWVLPSEHYYYFEIQAHGRRIAGNLRFTDAGAGKLHCGVYDRDNTSFMGYAVLAEGDGLVIKSEAGGPHPIYHVRDEATGVERRFVVPLPHMPPAPLMPGEELISPVLDESGFQFLLVYDRACCQFKYLLTAAPLDASFYGGRLSGRVAVHTRAPVAFEGALTATGVSLDLLRGDIAPTLEVRGTAAAQVDFESPTGDFADLLARDPVRGWEHLDRVHAERMKSLPLHRNSRPAHMPAGSLPIRGHHAGSLGE